MIRRHLFSLCLAIASGCCLLLAGSPLYATYSDYTTAVTSASPFAYWNFNEATYASGGNPTDPVSLFGVNNPNVHGDVINVTSAPIVNDVSGNGFHAYYGTNTTSWTNNQTATAPWGGGPGASKFTYFDSLETGTTSARHAHFYEGALSAQMAPGTLQPGNSSFGTSLAVPADFTVEVWVRPDADTDAQGSSSTIFATRSWGAAITESLTPHFITYGRKDFISSAVLNPGQWYMLDYVYRNTGVSSSQVDFYVNGVLIDSVTDTNAGARTDIPAEFFRIAGRTTANGAIGAAHNADGGGGTGNAAHGLGIDELVLFDNVQTSVDILARYNAALFAAAASLDLTGAGNGIADGDSTPSLADNTDFGTAIVGMPTSRVFRVDNSGSGTLNISGLTLPLGYSLLDGLNSAILAGGFDTFTVQFDAASLGTFAGDIVITNDSPTTSYNFAITGTVLPLTALPEPASVAIWGALGLVVAMAARRHKR